MKKLNLNLGVLFEILKCSLEVVVCGENEEYGRVVIKCSRDLNEEDIEMLSKNWIGGVEFEEEFICCWGGGNVLCDNELGINLKDDEKYELDFSDSEFCYGYGSFEEYWNDVRGKIVGLSRYEDSIKIY